MSNLKTPKECGQIAEQHIGQYVKECGAFGDPERLKKVLEMLISKASLGLVGISDGQYATDVLLRTSLSAATYAEKIHGGQQGRPEMLS